MREERRARRLPFFLLFFFFSFLLRSRRGRRVRSRGLPPLRSTARLFVVPVLPFVSPARNGTPCLRSCVTQYPSQINRV